MSLVNSKQLLVWLSPQDKNALVMLAFRKGCSISAYIRGLIREKRRKVS